jgi:hypothetical protein
MLSTPNIKKDLLIKYYKRLPCQRRTDTQREKKRCSYGMKEPVGVSGVVSVCYSVVLIS